VRTTRAAPRARRRCGAAASTGGALPLARELARNGDPRALAAIDRMAHFLGSGLAFLITALAPE
jgi:predicted NBD/HSP70 family sugar kinase